MICFLWLTLLPHVPPDFRLDNTPFTLLLGEEEIVLFPPRSKKRHTLSAPSARNKWFTYTRITVPTKRFWFLLYKQKSLSIKLQLDHSHITYYSWYKIKCNSDDVKTRQFIYAPNPGLRGGGEGGLEQRRKTSEQSVLFCVDSSGVFGFLIS